MASPSGRVGASTWGVLRNPLRWSEADKCLLVVAIMLPGIGLFMLTHRMFNGWLYMPPNVDPGTMAFIDTLVYLGVSVWTVMLGVAHYCQ